MMDVSVSGSLGDEGPFCRGRFLPLIASTRGRALGRKGVLMTIWLGIGVAFLSLGSVLYIGLGFDFFFLSFFRLWCGLWDE